MKQYVVMNSIGLVRDFFPEYDERDLDRIRYGIESVYLTFTKIIVILSLSIVLGMFKETILLLLFYNLLRWTGFGLHATKSWMCWLSSSLIFLGIPILCRYILVPKLILWIGGVLSLLCFVLYAPADTKKRPLINKKKRLYFKVFTIFNGTIYLGIIMLLEPSLYTNLLFFAMLIESVTIHPLTYKIFHLPYQNYKSYVLHTLKVNG